MKSEPLKSGSEVWSSDAPVPQENHGGRPKRQWYAPRHCRCFGQRVRPKPKRRILQSDADSAGPTRNPAAAWRRLPCYGASFRHEPPLPQGALPAGGGSRHAAAAAQNARAVLLAASPPAMPLAPRTAALLPRPGQGRQQRRQRPHDVAAGAWRHAAQCVRSHGGLADGGVLGQDAVALQALVPVAGCLLHARQRTCEKAAATQRSALIGRVGLGSRQNLVVNAAQL